MKYVYNKERDRIACKIGDPHFAIVTFKDVETKEERSLYLHACTGLKRHLWSIAEKYAYDNEQITNVKEISRKAYEKWVSEKEEIETLTGKHIPISYVVNYLIADDSPTPDKRSGRYGDLSVKVRLLADRDFNLLQALEESYELASEKNDIVRITEDPANDRSHEYLLE